MKKPLLLAAVSLSMLGLSGCVVQPVAPPPAPAYYAAPAPVYYAAPAPYYYPSARIYVGGGYGHRW